VVCGGNGERLLSELFTPSDIAEFSESDEGRFLVVTTTLVQYGLDSFADTSRQVIVHSTGGRDPHTCKHTVQGTFDSCAAQLGHYYTNSGVSCYKRLG